jgi:hypothetical protein
VVNKDKKIKRKKQSIKKGWHIGSNGGTRKGEGLDGGFVLTIILENKSYVGKGIKD